jgi:stalled ribosome alternative rescue factor ArfA
MGKSKKRPQPGQAPHSRNPMAKAVHQPLFRGRVVKSKMAYSRKEKHKARGSREPYVFGNTCQPVCGAYGY